MRGINLQDGPHKHQHYPLVIDKGDVGLIGDETREIEVLGIDEGDTGKDEEHARDNHDLAQATDGEIVAFITLLPLHGDKSNRTDQKHPGKDFGLPQEGTATGPDGHEQAPNEHEGGLPTTERLHRLPPGLLSRR